MELSIYSKLYIYLYSYKQKKQVKTLCNVAQETSDNIEQEKTQCNVVWVSTSRQFFFWTG